MPLFGSGERRSTRAEAWESRLFPEIYDHVKDTHRVKYGVLNAVNDPQWPHALQCDLWASCLSMFELFCVVFFLAAS